MAVSEAAASGNRLVALEALRDTLATAIDECDSKRDLAALSRQLTDVLAQIESSPSSAEVSAADEVAQRRASRRAGAAGAARSKRSS